MAKICYICKGKFEDKHAKVKQYCKVWDYCYYTVEYRSTAHSKCNLKYSAPKQIPIVFHNGSNYVCHLIIKKLAEEFEELVSIYLFRRKY